MNTFKRVGSHIKDFFCSILKMGKMSFSAIFSFSFLLIIIIILLFASSVVVLLTFANPREDSIALTNIGFAVLAAISSICFSWARSLEPDEKLVAKDIVLYGEFTFLSALLYLTASALKFGYLSSLKGKNGSYLILSRDICLYSSVTIFTLAFVASVVSVSMLLFIVIKRRIMREPYQ